MPTCLGHNPDSSPWPSSMDDLSLLPTVLQCTTRRRRGAPPLFLFHLFLFFFFTILDDLSPNANRSAILFLSLLSHKVRRRCGVVRPQDQAQLQTGHQRPVPPLMEPRATHDTSFSILFFDTWSQWRREVLSGKEARPLLQGGPIEATVAGNLTPPPLSSPPPPAPPLSPPAEDRSRPNHCIGLENVHEHVSHQHANEVCHDYNYEVWLS